MKNYTKIKVIRISESQLNTLQKMKSYNIDVGRFIRDAISEKIKREYLTLIPEPKKYMYRFDVKINMLKFKIIIIYINNCCIFVTTKKYRNYEQLRQRIFRS